MRSETPLKEQLAIVAALCAAIVVFILVVAGSDVYIQRYDFPRWLEIIFNVVSLLFAIAAANAFFNHYVASKSKPEKNK